MPQGTITCPKCGHAFELSEALTHQIRDHLKVELQADITRRESEAKRRLDEVQAKEAAVAKARDALNDEVEKQLKEKLAEVETRAAKKAEGRFSDQLKEMQDALKEREESIKTFRANELELRKQKQALEKAREEAELEVQRRLEDERTKIRKDAESKAQELQADIAKREAEAKRKLDEAKAKEESLAKARESLNDEVEKQLKQKLVEAESRAAKKAEDRFTDQLKELQESLKVKDDSLKAIRTNELELRKQKQALEAEKEEFDLKLQRTLDSERATIRKQSEESILEQHRLKDLEKDTKIQQLNELLEEANRKAKQGSMETQGEVLEQDFETRLKLFFTHDEIQPVPKGIRGADLIQSVRTPLGTDCGVLLWEMKNTKAWSGQWISKLKDDMIETRASIAILVTVALPEGITRFGMVEGVWVTEPLSAIPLAAALRQQLVALDHERQASVGKSQKMEMLYHYLAGTEFKQKIEGIVEAFTTMQDQVNRERRAMEKNWKEREKQIERVIKNTVGLYGDMQGIIGGKIPSIPALELSGSTTSALADEVTPEIPE